MKQGINGIFKYAIVIVLSFSAGYIVSFNNEQVKHIYIANSWFSISMIDDLKALNSIKNGGVESALALLEANVFGGLVGWDSTGLIGDLRAREPEGSPYLEDLNEALEMAREYSNKNHNASVAERYNRIIKKYINDNK